MHIDEDRRTLSKGLHTVIRAVNELGKCPDVDSLCRRAVELAREHLGIERCAVLLDAGDCVRGTYGTDLSGGTTDEHAYRDEKGEFWGDFHTRKARESAWFRIERDHTEWDGQRPVPCGRGWVVITPILSSSGEAIGVFTNDRAVSGGPLDEVAQDILAVYCSHLGPIIDRKQAEVAFQESEQRFRDLADLMPQPLWETDLQGTFTYTNRAGYEKFGYSDEDLRRGLQAPAVFVPEDRKRMIRAFALLVRGEHVENHEYTCMTADGRTFPALVFSSLIVRKREPVGIRGITLDISERVALENQLRQAQKLESVGMLASGVAHEINSPVNSIINYAQLIADKLEPDSPLAGYAGKIGSESSRVATIVKNLLAFARDEKQRHRPIPVSDIVESTLSLVRAVLRHDQIALEVDVPADIPMIKCRTQQMQQVIMNLVTNARDALNEKYPGRNEDKLVRIAAAVLQKNGGCRVRLTVEDHGTGIPEHVCEHLFDPFFTSKRAHKGTGLGLSVSYGIVREHGGDMSVESVPGQWAKFHLDLPVDEESNPERAEA